MVTKGGKQTFNTGQEVELSLLSLSAKKVLLQPYSHKVFPQIATLTWPSIVRLNKVGRSNSPNLITDWGKLVVLLGK
jgi:hypothetical protein